MKRCTKSSHINEDVMLNLWDTVKEEKKKRMKKYKVRPFSHLEKCEEVKSQSKWGLSAVLKNYVSKWASERVEKNRESKRKLWEIHSEKENSEWKEKDIFFSQVVSLYNIVKLFRVCPMVFPFKEKGFLRKFLCTYMVVLLLCLLKFIHNYI